MEAKKNENTGTSTHERAKRKSVTGNMLGRALRGRLISTDFFSRHWITVALLVLMFVWYITNKYECQTSMETIQKLEKELEIVKTERIREQSDYMSRIRESSMRKLVRRNHLDLEVQDTPPFKIHYNCK
ncbi:MAG: FtsL-like putative cell division protein [Clostridiales bacterium]|nr:FtsL-like putative cell division protein [Clostridiales bacterium]